LAKKAASKNSILNKSDSPIFEKEKSDHPTCEEKNPSLNKENSSQERKKMNFLSLSNPKVTLS
jgi:hypothetical protein